MVDGKGNVTRDWHLPWETPRSSLGDKASSGHHSSEVLRAATAMNRNCRGSFQQQAGASFLGLSGERVDVLSVRM